MPVFAGFAAIGGALGSFMFGSAVFTGIAVSAVVGAAIGGITAALTGGDITQGLLWGAVGGLVVGGVFGGEIAGAIAPSMGTAGEVAAGVTQGGDLVMANGTVLYGQVGTGGMTSALTGMGGSSGLSDTLIAGIPGAVQGMLSGSNTLSPEEQRAEAQLERESRERIANMQINAARAGDNFHLEEKLKLQKEGIWEPERIRRAQNIRAGGVRRSFGTGTSTQRREQTETRPGVTPMVGPTAGQEVTSQSTALRGLA